MSTEEETKAPEAEAPAAPAEAQEEEKAHEEENTAHFEPVVQLEEVEVKSGEEDEEVLHSVRGKLFVYGETLLDVGSGNKTWKERGIGEVKLLRHKELGRSRLLMRQEKTMKVIANHAMDPRLVLEPNVGSDRSWVWSAFDFAEGELKETVFAVRFKDSDIANEFKVKFEETQKDMEKVLAGEDKPDEDGTAAEAAEALAGLSTKADEGEEPAAAEAKEE